jgi:hypothetical protein
LTERVHFQLLHASSHRGIERTGSLQEFRRGKNLAEHTDDAIRTRFAAILSK